MSTGAWERTREAWTRYSVDFKEPGRRAWGGSPKWGIWNVPEAEVGMFGDPAELRGLRTIELGCGTGYVSSWLARLGARPVGLDLTPAQLANAREFQKEHGLEFPLVQASATAAPFADGSFDFAISEYGASIWCDPHAWLPEAARLLRPGGRLSFFRNHPLSVICSPDVGVAEERLIRPWFGMNRVEFTPDEPLEYHLPTDAMFRLLRSIGFEVLHLQAIQAPEGQTTRFEYITAEWARRWPSEEAWVCRKRR